jgi:hypothetical protein
MERVARRPSTRAWIVLALVALLGLAVAAGSGSASASGPGHAVMAKKCKKHKRSAAASKKKKKCKKVRHVVLPAPAPLVRATVSWTANDEVDLHAFDANGNHAGWVDPTGVVNNIPSARHTGDAGPGGPSESFTDDIYVVGGPSNREFAYAVCLYNQPTVSAYTATFVGVTAGGTATTLTLDGPGIYRVTAPSGPTLTDSQVAGACGV